MISYKDIKDIINALKTEGVEVRVRDVAYLVLCDSFTDKSIASKVAYQDEEAPSARVLANLSEKLKPFGIGAVNTISKDENREELLKLLQKIQKAEEDNLIDPKDAIKLETDIRVKLNDKFNIEEEEGQKRIIVVPQKHDTVCKYTNRECSAMPSKEACMRYYKLTDINK